MSLDVDGQHRILNQILGLRCTSANGRELAFVIGTQAAAQLVEQRAVRSRVAIQAGKHQCLEFDFVGRHACVSLLVRWPGRFGYSRWCRKRMELAKPAHYASWHASVIPLLANGRTLLPLSEPRSAFQPELPHSIRGADQIP